MRGTCIALGNVIHRGRSRDTVDREKTSLHKKWNLWWKHVTHNDNKKGQKEWHENYTVGSSMKGDIKTENINLPKQARKKPPRQSEEVMLLSTGRSDRSVTSKECWRVFFGCCILVVISGLIFSSWSQISVSFLRQVSPLASFGLQKGKTPSLPSLSRNSSPRRWTFSKGEGRMGKELVHLRRAERNGSEPSMWETSSSRKKGRETDERQRNGGWSHVPSYSLVPLFLSRSKGRPYSPLPLASLTQSSLLFLDMMSGWRSQQTGKDLVR